MSIPSSLLDEFTSLLGPKAVVRHENDMEPYMKEWRGRVVGKAPCVLLPESKEQVASIVKLCQQHKTPLVPQSGNTGLVGAGVPTTDNSMVLLSLKRLNKIRTIDAPDFSMVAEGGTVLSVAKEEAEKKNRLLAMTLASEGSAGIGGLIATNAGGSFTLRYGNMREQVLGLEAVMADGSIYSDLRTLRKNNSGYDLKQLLIGSEGTLGIITAAALKLMPKPARVETALIAFSNPQKAIEALGLLREATGDRLAAFEIMPHIAIECAVRFISGQRDPFSTPHPWIALVETHEAMGDYGILETALGMLVEKSVALDAVLAQSEAQNKSFWGLREAIVEAQKHLGGSLKHDLSVPVGRTAELIEKGAALVLKRLPGTRIYSFGHIGDGNIHFNLGQPEGMDKDQFLSHRAEIASLLNDLVLSLGGSISAEHGIGRFYRDEFLRVTPAVPLDLMRKIKSALDPENILNPGVIL